MTNDCIDKASFIHNALIETGHKVINIDDDSMSHTTLYRKNNDSLFLLITIGHDFREPNWSIIIKVGQGFANNKEDPVELDIASISLVELNIIHSESINLSIDIKPKILESIFEDAIDYCIKFTNGESSQALDLRSIRNNTRKKDPLLLNSDNSHLKSILQERNDELKSIYAQYS